MSEPRTVAEDERRVLATVTRLRAAAHRRVFRGSGSVGELHLNPRVQHIGSHPHSPGRCGRRPFIFTVLRTCQMSILAPAWLAVLMMQFWTYFWRFRQCQLNFMPFASTLHAAVAFSRATLSALDIFAASAGVGMNAMPLTSTVAIIPANEAVAKWYMIRSFELIRSLELLVRYSCRRDRECDC